MIRGQREAELELRVVERERRFLEGLRWHLRDALDQLQAEEGALLARLAPAPPPLERGPPAPSTPPLGALLALDPLGEPPSMQLGGRSPDDEAPAELELRAAPRKRP